MLRILERYIAKTLLFATAIAALTILGVLFLMSLLGELKTIGEGDYGIMAALYYVLMRLPSSLYQFSPLWILLGSILGLSMLSAHRELAVMRASGFSILQIIRSVLLTAFILILSATLIGESVGPALSAKAEIHKENEKNAGSAVVTASGIWFHVDNSFIHVQQVMDRQLLEGVTLYQFDDKQHLLATFYAKKLAYENKEWKMHDVVKTTFINNRTHSEAFASLPWDMKFNTNLLNMGLLEPSEMSLSKLSKFVRYMEANRLQATEYKFVYWQRVFQPLAALIMIFLAIPFVLGALNNSPLGWRIMVGILTGFAFFILNALLGQLAVVFQLPAIAAALSPILLFAMVGVVLVRKLVRQ